MKFPIYFLILISFATSALAQTADVNELLERENYFAALVKQKGMKKAFLKVSDKNTLIYKPQPVNAVKYYKAQPDSINLGVISWEPVFARIAKSGEWGFTSGPFIFKETEDGPPAYHGSYVSVWKKDKKGKWKLAVDLGVSHKKPTKRQNLDFLNPSNNKYIHQRSLKRLQQREEIVFNSDKLLSTIQKADNKIALKEFLAPDSRLIFPDYEPLIGKEAIINFWKKREFWEKSTPIIADRAYSGEFAFTRGDATIIGKTGPKKYHYLRIWQLQPEFNWNIILQIYTEAGL